MIFRTQTVLCHRTTTELLFSTAISNGGSSLQCYHNDDIGIVLQKKIVGLYIFENPQKYKYI
jgi:hypothetical protein